MIVDGHETAETPTNVVCALSYPGYHKSSMQLLMQFLTVRSHVTSAACGGYESGIDMLQRLGSSPAVLPGGGSLTGARSGSAGGRPLTSVSSQFCSSSHNDKASPMPWDNSSAMHREPPSRQQTSIDMSDVGRVEDLRPCTDPIGELQRTIVILNASNVASRLELDWQAQLQVRRSFGHASLAASVHAAWAYLHSGPGTGCLPSQPAK